MEDMTISFEGITKSVPKVPVIKHTNAEKDSNSNTDVVGSKDFKAFSETNENKSDTRLSDYDSYGNRADDEIEAGLVNEKAEFAYDEHAKGIYVQIKNKHTGEILTTLPKGRSSVLEMKNSQEEGGIQAVEHKMLSSIGVGVFLNQNA